MAQDNRTEKATPKKREDERKKGNVFQSREITNVFGLLLIFFSLKLLAPFYFRYFQETLAFYFDSLAVYRTFPATQIGSVTTDMVVRTLILAAPIGLIAAASSIVFSLAQTRLNISKEQIRFKISRLNLLNGLRSLISLKTIVELVKSIIKIVGIGAVLYSNIFSRLPKIIQLLNTNLDEAVYFIADAVFSTVIYICIIMIVFAVLDYLYQWWDYERRMRMTKQEVKEEYKLLEGDPQIKSRIRERQRSMAYARMMQQLPQADVVVRNPTHYAVALKYEPEKYNAPVVVAKGKGYVALKIIEVAEKHDITIVENKPLAQGLYQAVELNQEIPAQFYQAVAELLAFVYKLKKKKWYLN